MTKIYSFEENTPAEAWRTVLKLFPTQGVKVNDTKALDGIIVTMIKHPTSTPEKNPMYQIGFLNEYKKQLLDPDKHGFEYTYGNRLCDYDGWEDHTAKEGINQIGYIIHILKKDRTSRRAIAITWLPIADIHSKDVPCLQLVKCRVHNEKLHMEVVFRSHDMLGGYYPNVLGLSYLMEHIAERVDVRIGTLTVVSLSPHVYLKQADAFRAVTKVKL